MDKDKLQLGHHSVSHFEMHAEEVQVNASTIPNQDILDKNADMDALEAQLFAMAKHRG